MPSKKRYCCFPKCYTRIKNGSRGKEISGQKKRRVTGFLYGLLKEENGCDFKYSSDAEVCSPCEMKVRSVQRFKEGRSWKYPNKLNSIRLTETLLAQSNSEDFSAESLHEPDSSHSPITQSRCTYEDASHSSFSLPAASNNSESHSLDVGFTQESEDFELGGLAVSLDINPNEVRTFQDKTCDHTSGDIPFTIPNLPSIVPTQRKCSFCPLAGRKRIPLSAIFDAYVKVGVIIPPQNRCCDIHLDGDLIKPDVLANVVAQKDSTQMTGQQVSKWMRLLRSEILTNRKVLDFEKQNYEESVYDMFLGVSKANFERLHSECEGMRKSKNRCTRNALAMLLVKLRLNLSQRVIAFLFDVKNRSTVGDSIFAALKSLEAFVKRNLGYQHKTRAEFIRLHGRRFFRIVLGLGEDALILILDGTYLYSEKSSNHKVQKKMYSGHKHRNLFKPMIICLPDGQFLEIEGLYFADHGNNDSTILKSMLKREDSIRSILRPGDATILDRGFRDVVPDLESHGIEVFMPSFFQKKNPDGTKKVQFTTEEANASRRVTLLRRLVEQANGRIKNKFIFFEHTIRATNFKKLNKYLRVAGAILNAFSPILFTETEFHEKVASQVEEHFEDENVLMKRVVDGKWASKRTIWNKVDEDCCLTFPSLSMNELEDLMLGTYQLKMGIKYNDMHMLDTGMYEYFYHKDEPTIIRIKIQSRHSRRTQYTVWIEYKESVNEKDGIVGWYCLCKTGSRTLGSCSHIAAVLRYLSHDRFLPPKPFRDISDYFLDAASELARYEMDVNSEELQEAESSEESDSDNEEGAMLFSDEEEELLSVH